MPSAAEALATPPPGQLLATPAALRERLQAALDRFEVDHAETDWDTAVAQLLEAACETAELFGGSPADILEAVIEGQVQRLITSASIGIAACRELEQLQRSSGA
jgi:hypothetical protein